MVEVLLVDGQARVAGAAHALEGGAHGLGVLDGHDVDARLHDVGGRELVEREDLADHALLVFEQLVVVVDELLDLFL